MVYDDARRRPVLGIIILSNHYQVDAFPRDKGRFETLWVGDLEESEASEYVGKLQADGSVIKDMGTGLKELAWANRLPRWKKEVEYSVESARASRHARTLMAMIAEGGTAGLSMTRLLTLEDKSVLSFGGCVPHREALQRGLLLRQEAACLLVREPAPPGRLPGADDPAQRVVRVVAVARVVATTRAQTRPQLNSQRPSNANSPCTKRRGRLVGLIDWRCKLAPVRAPRAPVYVDF